MIHGNIITVVIRQSIAACIIPSFFGRADTGPYSVNADVVIHREPVRAIVRGIVRRGHRHHITHHGEAVLGVGEAGGAVLPLFGGHVQNFRALLSKVDGLTAGFLGCLHRFGIGDGDGNRRRRLQCLPIQRKPDVKEPGEYHRVRLSCLLHGGGSLAQVILIFLGIPGNLRYLQGHALGQRRVRPILNQDGIIRALKGQVRQHFFLLGKFTLLRVDMLFQRAAAAAPGGVDMAGFAAEEFLLR